MIRKPTVIPTVQSRCCIEPGRAGLERNRPERIRSERLRPQNIVEKVMLPNIGVESARLLHVDIEQPAMALGLVCSRPCYFHASTIHCHTMRTCGVFCAVVDDILILVDTTLGKRYLLRTVVMLKVPLKNEC
jgi:hypothetical protein